VEKQNCDSEIGGVSASSSEGRSDDAVEELCLTALAEEQRKAVKTVCSDMRQPYIKGIKAWFTNAFHCHDPFHCAGYLNKAADKCRKREVKQHGELRRTK
jgi:transposase